MCVVIMSGYVVPDLCILNQCLHVPSAVAVIERKYFTCIVYGEALYASTRTAMQPRNCASHGNFFAIIFQFQEGLSWQLCALHCLDASVLINL